MPRRFNRLLREYFLVASVFVVLLVLMGLLYAVDHIIGWGIF